MAKKTSPWLYIGCGCATLAGLAVVAVIAAGFFGASMFQGYVEEMQDPQARAEKAKEILGTENLPEGYHARLHFSIPWVMDMVFLSDGTDTEEGVFDENFQAFESQAVGDHVFIFFSIRGDSSGKDFDEIFESRRRSGEVQFDMGGDFRSEEELGQGEIDLDPQKLSYVAHRGELETEDRERIAGIYAQVKAICPSRDRTRVAVWFQRTQADLPEGTPPDIPGTPADENALRDFMSHFNLCTK